MKYPFLPFKILITEYSTIVGYSVIRILVLYIYSTNKNPIKKASG